MSHFPDPADRDRVRDGINREYHAIRRSLRELLEDEQQLERKMSAFAASQRRTRAAVEAASKADHPFGGHHDRVSWRTLAPGADVVAADGVRVGAVQEVQADHEVDIFDGVVIDIRLGPGGLRYVKASDIAMLFEHRIVLRVPSARVPDLPKMSRRNGGTAV